MGKWVLSRKPKFLRVMSHLRLWVGSGVEREVQMFAAHETETMTHMFGEREAA